jgi:hypothetical protein
MFTSIFGYGPGSGTLTLWIRIRIWRKFRILADPDTAKDPDARGSGSTTLVTSYLSS